MTLAVNLPLLVFIISSPNSQSPNSQSSLLYHSHEPRPWPRRWRCSSPSWSCWRRSTAGLTRCGIAPWRTSRSSRPTRLSCRHGPRSPRWETSRTCFRELRWGSSAKFRALRASPSTLTATALTLALLMAVYSSGTATLGPISLSLPLIGLVICLGLLLFWLVCGFIDDDIVCRTELCDPKPSALMYLKNEHVCGRPLGLRFDKKSGDLYIADAYFGLLKVGPEGGLATQLTTEAEGVPLKFTNDFDFDEDGNVYFTDSSSNYQRRYAQSVNFVIMFFLLYYFGDLISGLWTF